MKRTVFTILALVAMLSTLSIAAASPAPAFSGEGGFKLSASALGCDGSEDLGSHIEVSDIHPSDGSYAGTYKHWEVSISGDGDQPGHSGTVSVRWDKIGDYTGKNYGHNTKDKSWETDDPNCEPEYQVCSETITIASNWQDQGAPVWGPWVDNGDGTSTRTGYQVQVSHFRVLDARDKKTLCDEGTNTRRKEISQTKDNDDPSYNVRMECDRAAGDGVHYQAIIFFDLGQGARGIEVDGKKFANSGHKYVGFGKYSFTVFGGKGYNDSSGSVKLTSGDCNGSVTTVDAGGPVDPLAGVLGGVALIALLGAGGLALRKRSA